jgi:hypothetical protein
VTFVFRGPLFNAGTFQRYDAAMLMVVFGAGASYDCVPAETKATMNQDYRPPLAKDLFQNRPAFSERLNAYRYISSVVPRLRRLERSGGNIEDELEKLRAEGQRHEPTQWALNAIRFYLRDILTACGDTWHEQALGGTFYAEMIRILDMWRPSHGEPIVFVTFNYDTLLEAGIRTALNIDLGKTSEHDSRLTTYVARPDYQLFKLHGSVNWEVAVPSGSFSDLTGVRTLDELIRRTNVVPTDSFAYPGMFASENIAAYPAIAIPLQNKSDSDFACPTFHQQKLKEVLPKVTRLITIGWRGAERHFLELLAGQMTSLRRGWAVSYDIKGAGETAANLATVGIAVEPLSGGFSGFVETGTLDSCLVA